MSGCVLVWGREKKEHNIKKEWANLGFFKSEIFQLSVFQCYSLLRCVVFFFFSFSLKSQFPVAKLPLPVGSEVSCRFRCRSNISDPPPRPHNFLKVDRCISVGLHQGAMKKRRGHGFLPRAYNRLFKADQSIHSRPGVTVVTKRAFDGDPYLSPWSENEGL